MNSMLRSLLVLGLSAAVGGGWGRGPASPPLQEPPPPQESPPAEQVPPRERPRPADAAELFALFARSPGFEAEYEETKHLALLALPLRSQGRLYFLPPGYLLRRVTHPEPSSVRIRPGDMTVVDRSGEKRLDFATAPELRHFATSLVRVFAGEREGLAPLWTIEYRASPDGDGAEAVAERATGRRWALRLTPRTDVPGQEALAHLVQRLELLGEGQHVDSIEFLEPSGDRTVTRILSVQPDREYSDAERLEFFGLGPRPAAGK
jgi:hypothetical protein